ncbi:hypothetical protein KK141_03400 [Dyella sp. LX-66]|uniref:post-PEP-CTERM-1 domain-containing protein n=1 Tax=unclassified Dyella TaxID=2634549 RepID=UPI001BE0BC4D|nr:MULTISPECIES: hypothetical protein [unclassified Dyella]MBT2117517.1 hypothetical protein [Dyella sp. LX-1]MBT2119362.1 hypothetical protein [Dyella sp. LX-1]MBT2138581.1 hypothetical protein [Dyella sp. LX-66]
MAGKCGRSKVRAAAVSRAALFIDEEYRQLKNETGIHLLGLVLIGLFAAAASAAEGPAKAPAPTQNHQVAFRDPLTGELRAPTEAEMAKLQRAMEEEQAVQPRSLGAPAKADERLHWRDVDLGNGSKGKIATLPDRLQSRLVMERGADGEYRVQHAAGAAAAAPEATP